jgi:hypothetical protein
MNNISRTFSLSVLRPGAPETLVPFIEERAAAWGITAHLSLQGEELMLSLTGAGEAVVTLWMKPWEDNLFPLLPGFMIGHNRPEDTGPYYPQMTVQQDINLPNMKSPFWGIRADRATLPAAFLFGKTECRALAVPPYLDNPGAPHTVNGLRVCLERGVGVSIGFVVEPVQFVHNGVAAPGYRGYHLFRGAVKVPLRYFSVPTEGRRGHAAIVRRLYELGHEKAPCGDGIRASVRMTADALVNDMLIPAQTTMAHEMQGDLFRIKDGNPRRDLLEIGWTAGSMLAYPFLALQKRYRRPELASYAVRLLDRICTGINPASGFFWDCQQGSENHAIGWWTGLAPSSQFAYTQGQSGAVDATPVGAPVAHYAYVQGHACYYLLRSAAIEPARAATWIGAARQVLEQVLKWQQPNGQFPVSYSIADGTPERIIGFAGCWFAAALVELFGLTRERRYLDAAIRAVRSYHAEVAVLEPCATPMDTHNATDQEGNLALLHAAARLHALTGEGEFLAILRDSADFEMLWRYYYNVRAPHAPLDKADWGSSGGSVTSAHNPHIHPMHLNALDPVLYLADRTGDAYYLERTKDAVRYGCCCVCRPSEDFGWGKPGWLCERFCPSDGLVIQHNLRTGVPWAAGCDYHPWNVGVLLEGLTGEAWDRFPDLA